MPAMMQGMFPMEIFQRREQINITQEAFNQTRRIYMGETLKPASELDPMFYGHSVGHWEGDTLVIETTGIKQNVQYRWTPHSEDMKITERLPPADARHPARRHHGRGSRTSSGRGPTRTPTAARRGTSCSSTCARTTATTSTSRA
jgi:hypothetical protein